MKLKSHLESRLSSARQKNDSVMQSDQTNQLRGRIKELKYLLSLLSTEATEVEIDDGLD